MKKITIFTPTYNRINTINRLYKSLIKQTNLNFIWLVVDDGSTDNTSIEIEKYKKENIIDIEYYYKENGGKHSAHNFAVNNCHTDYFLILDSDDYLNKYAIEKLLNYIKKIDLNDKISGIIGSRFNVDGTVIGNPMPDNVVYSTGINLYEKYNIKGDTLRLYKTKILKDYLFPSIYGEKFMPENIVFDQIDEQYKMYVIKDELYICDYQTGGYSNNIFTHHLKSPISYSLSLESSAFHSKSLINKIKWTILYQIWSDNIKCIDPYSNFRNKILFKLCTPISKLFKIIKYPKFMFNELNDNKIAIITLYGNNNFGNKLQNYALQKTLNYMGYNVFTIKCKYRYLNKIKNFKIIIGGIIKDLLKLNHSYKKEKLFNTFNKNYIRYSKRFLKTNDKNNCQIKGYKKIIYGSDQIWNPSCLGNSQLFLGYKGTKEKNISYAASFGISSIPNNMINYYKNGLMNFNSISVRELQGKKIINDFNINIDVEVVLDPTLLLEKDEWNKIIKPPKKDINFKYVLNYFLGELDENTKKEIEKIATEKKYKIINIMDINSDYYNAGPSEFLYLVKNASLICTDSYHSCVFSLIFNKPFIVFERIHSNGENMYSRIDTLLTIFKLKNRKYNGKKITINNLEHNYKDAYRILEIEKKKSKEFLKSSLDNKAVK